MSSPKKKYHFQDNIFTLKESVNKKRKIDFFKDGPNTTVAILGYPFPADTKPLLIKIFGKKSHSLFVNGKSDGNTLGDFLPTYYLPVLPYLHIAKEGPLDAAVIGLGTGTTAGILGKSRDIREVSVLEIAPKVIEGIRKEKHYPFNPLFMKKTRVIQTDAFKFFTRSQKKYDIIVAEPSNPWVVGVENLYTIDFYNMVLDSLSEKGIFSQWMHIYSADREMLHMVFDSMRRSFPYLKAYITGVGDITILGAKRPFQLSSPLAQRRFYEMKEINFSIGLRKLEDLSLLNFLDNEYIRHLGKKNKSPHSLEAPRLSYLAHKAFFLGERYSTSKDSNIEERLARRILLYDRARLEAFQSYTKSYRNYGLKDRIKIRQRCAAKKLNSFCVRLDTLLSLDQRLFDPTLPIKKRLDSYTLLRDQGLIPLSRPFFASIRKDIVRAKPKLSVLLQYFFNLVAEGMYTNIVPDMKIMTKADKRRKVVLVYVKKLIKIKKKLPRRSVKKSVSELLEGM